MRDFLAAPFGEADILDDVIGDATAFGLVDVLITILRRGREVRDAVSGCGPGQETGVDSAAALLAGRRRGGNKDIKIPLCRFVKALRQPGLSGGFPNAMDGFWRTDRMHALGELPRDQAGRRTVTLAPIADGRGRPRLRRCDAKQRAPARDQSAFGAAAAARGAALTTPACVSAVAICCMRLMRSTAAAGGSTRRQAG